MKKIPDIILIIVSYWLLLFIGAAYPEYFSNIFIRPANALRSFTTLLLPSSHNEMWRYPETSPEKGVIHYDEENSWGDYTIYANTQTNKTVVIDMQGQVVHEWSTGFTTENLSYPDIVTITRVFSDPQNSQNLYVIFTGEKLFYNTYGLKKFGPGSNLIWYNNHTLHHDVIFLENSHLLTYETQLRHEELPDFPNINPPVYEDALVFLDNQGKIYRQISLLDAFTDSPCKSVLETVNRFQIDPQVHPEDIFHPNSIEIVPKHVARTLPNVAENSVMLSFRNTDMIAFLDLDTEKITWAPFGPWKRQHSARFLENGHIILLDNEGHNGPGGRSRLLEIDLKDMSIVWEYTGTPEKPFYTEFNGMLDVLPNGNILVTETHSGRIFEITKEKEIVWDYYIDQRIPGPEGPLVPSIISAQRFTKDQLAPLIKK